MLNIVRHQNPGGNKFMFAVHVAGTNSKDVDMISEKIFKQAKTIRKVTASLDNVQSSFKYGVFINLYVQLPVNKYALESTLDLFLDSIATNQGYELRTDREVALFTGATKRATTFTKTPIALQP